MKSVYLSLKEATKKWTGRISGWGEIYSQLSIYFEGRIKKNRMIKLPYCTIYYILSLHKIIYTLGQYKNIVFLYLYILH